MISGCAKCEVGRCFACVHYEHFAVDFFACRLNIFIVFSFFLVFYLVSCLACNVPLDFSAWDRSVYWIRWHFAAVAALQFVPLPDCLIASFQLGSAVATAIKSPFSARELQKNKKNLSLNVRPFTAFPPPHAP